MLEPYYYVTLVLATVWLLCYFSSKELRGPILWSSLAYTAILLMAAVALGLVDRYVVNIGQEAIIPFWNPHIFLDVSQAAVGISLGDILFAFFTGGIAASLYEFTFGKRIIPKHSRKHHLRSLLVGFMGAFLVGAVFQPNSIYLMITFGVFGALTIWVERPDLIPHSFWGGAIFSILYIGLFAIFFHLIPDLLLAQYNLASLSGHHILGVPYEELLYAFSFGLLWAPLYEYEHGLRMQA